MKMREILHRIRKSVYLTSRDVNPDHLTVEQIAELMKPVENPGPQRPMPFADTMARILKEEGCRAPTK